MMKEDRTPMDLMDDIYSLAYWMTGSDTAATDLVNRTYLSVERDTPEREVFKIFRACYFDGHTHEGGSCVSPPSQKPVKSLMVSLRNHDEDIKLSVLLSEISGLQHRSISKIIGKPIDTIRVWLSAGRRSLAEGAICCDAPLLHGASAKSDRVL